jgi:hypothetical protein
MLIADDLEARPEALDALKALLSSGSKATRIAAARVWGRFVELRHYSPRELKGFSTGRDGLYAVEEPVSDGIAIVMHFSKRQGGRSAGVKLLDVAEMIGPAQRAAAQQEASRYL